LRPFFSENQNSMDGRSGHDGLCSRQSPKNPPTNAQPPQAQIKKSFLVLFFKKERPFFHFLELI